MVEYGTDSIQAIVNLYPRFDGKDKTQFLECKFFTPWTAIASV